MIPMRRFIFTILILLLFLTGCSRHSGRNGIVIAGSTSVQPFADKLAEIYMTKYPDRVVNVQGGGSSAGIQAAKSGAANIGMSSRELTLEEKDLIEIVIARDGLAVIVHPQNPVGAITLEQVKGVFDGDIRNWKELGGPDKGITVVTREEGSGTRGAFQELIMKKERIFKSAIVEDSNGTVREIITGDPASIGYISLGLVNDKVKSLKIDGVEANDNNIINNSYKLVRPFLFVSKDVPAGESKEFIDFVLSDEGQTLLKKEGLIPAK
jgi:phosphate transport system substrate-binding protein